MAASDPIAGSTSRLAPLLGFLEQDPANPNLLYDAAAAALQEGDLKAAAGLIARAEAASAGAPAARLTHLKGLVALADQRHGDAAEAFKAVLASSPDDPVVRFNLAWARAMLNDFSGASELIDEAVVRAVPRAAGLKVQMLHHLGELEDALAHGQGFAELYPDDRDLMSALTEVAIDAEEADLARDYATRAGEGSPQGLAALGMLELAEERSDQAQQLFDQALARHPANARALLGKGLVLMGSGDAAAASPYLDQSAAIFGHHLGTWVAAGWARYAAGDAKGARERFEHALKIDDTFAEIHGALAVLDVMDGKAASACARADTALRLDRECLGAALALSLLTTQGGDPEKGQRILNLALNQPVGPGGKTIAQAMAGMGLIGRKG